MLYLESAPTFVVLRPRHCGRVDRRRSRPKKVSDVLHPLLRLCLRRSRHDETRRIAVDGEREVVRPENHDMGHGES